MGREDLTKYCSACGGNGRCPRCRRGACVLCQGKGCKLCDDTGKCPTCRGTTICPSCGGKGFFVLK